MTTNTGAAIGSNQFSKTAGENGPTLLEDVHLLEKIASFDRERVPERVVHARGTVSVHRDAKCSRMGDDVQVFTISHGLEKRRCATAPFAVSLVDLIDARPLKGVAIEIRITSMPCGHCGFNKCLRKPIR